MTLVGTLLALHVAAGFTALASALVASINKAMGWPHRWHIYSGNAFFWGMATVFATAVPLSIIRPNLFLLLLAVLSFYLALMGRRYAVNRKGTPAPIDWVTGAVMAVAALGMIAFGVYLLRSGDSSGVTMAAFGLLGCVSSMGDLRRMRSGGVRGKERIAQHLGLMLGGTIAAVTAFVVANFSMQPAFVLWLAPTVLITPLIIVWSRRVRAGRMANTPARTGCKGAGHAHGGGAASLLPEPLYR